MSETVVFLETSLNHQEAINILPDAKYLSSIRKGDVIRAIKKGYKRIVIIDGNFSWIPSVWHKEILMALDYGVEVFGAASMGAIRAAELDVYGMKGVGRVYEMYKNEEIDGDDEVAIAYSKYNNSQTIPLINIRLTLGKLNLDNKEEILNSIRHIFYMERTWNRLANLVPQDVYNLIKSNYLDVKKEDAKSVLSYLSQIQSHQKSINYVTKKRDFTFFEKKLIESTLYPALLSHSKLENKGEFSHLLRAKNIIKLISLPKTKKSLLYYQSAISLLDQQSYDVTESELIYQIEIFREEHNLLKGEEFISWLKNKYLYHSNIEQLFRDYIKLNKLMIITYDYNSYFN